MMRLVMLGIRSQGLYMLVRVANWIYMGRGLKLITGDMKWRSSLSYVSLLVSPEGLKFTWAKPSGRHESYVPASKRLLTDASSNVFIYMTGHGGNEFLKFQDNEEVSAFDIADAVEQMWEKRRSAQRPSFSEGNSWSNRYNRLFYMIDTCQANSMYSKFYSPNIISTGSSMVGENSYSVS